MIPGQLGREAVEVIEKIHAAFVKTAGRRIVGVTSGTDTGEPGCIEAGNFCGGF